MGDQGVTFGECSGGGISVGTVALAHGADDAVPDKEDSGRPPPSHWGYPMGNSAMQESAVRHTRYMISCIKGLQGSYIPLI